MRKLKRTVGSFIYRGRQAVHWQWLQLNCPLTRAALKEMPARQLIYGFNISSRHRYVYVGNPKTGGSSLKSALVELEMRDTSSSLDYYDPKTFRDRNISPLELLDKLPTKSPLAYLVNEGYKFITIVRNPYTRLLSCYRDKIIKGEHQKAKILCLLGYDQRDLHHPISFDEFAQVVVGQSNYEMDPHWRVQKTQILYSLLPYSLIGRFESYQSDFEKIFQELGVNKTDTPKLRHLHSTKSDRRERCKDFYTPALQELVYNRYRQDFEQFGYSHELPE